MHRRWIILLATLFASTSCATQHPTPPPKLASVHLRPSAGPAAKKHYMLAMGHAVQVLHVGPAVSPQGKTALVLKYVSPTSFEDRQTLRKESDDIWEQLVSTADKGNYDQAFIDVSEPSTRAGPPKHLVAGYFKIDGLWRRKEPKQRTKLDPEFMKEFIDRLDTDFRHGNANSVLLYMARDWTATYVEPGRIERAPQVVERIKAATMLHALAVNASNRKHHREITKITIAEDGVHAQVESRETESVTINNVTSTAVAHSIDSFELNDHVMLWTKSASVIESHEITRSS